MAAWRWIPGDDGDTKGIGFEDGSFFPWASNVGSRAELQNRLQLDAATYFILVSARGAFASGTADYVDAISNLKKLLIELFKAEQELKQTLQEISALLPGAMDRVESLADRISLAKEITTAIPSKPKAPTTVVFSPVAGEASVPGAKTPAERAQDLAKLGR